MNLEQIFLHIFIFLNLGNFQRGRGAILDGIALFPPKNGDCSLQNDMSIKFHTVQLENLTCTIQNNFALFFVACPEA